MQKSKLVQVFFSLSATERTAFRKFVASPYYNKREDVIHLLAYLEQFDDPNDPKLAKPTAFAYLFPHLEYTKDTDAQLRYSMSFLLKLIEAFLIEVEATRDQVRNQLSLARSFRRRNLPKHFKQSIRKVKKILNKTPRRDFDYYEQLFQVEQEEYLFTKVMSRNIDRNLQPLNDMQDVQFIAAKLKQSCLLLAHQNVYKMKYNMGLLDHVLTYVDSHPDLLQHAGIALYYYYYQSLTQEEGDHWFREFKLLLLNANEKFPDNELRDLYQFAINFCIRKLNLQSDGYEQYFYEMFELYKAGLTHQYLLENDQISPFTFKNVVSVSLRLEKYDWTTNFIKRYQKHLGEKHQKTYVNFTLSKLYFEQKNYDQALVLLQKVNYSDIFLNLNTKVMLMKIYYELDEYEVLESFLTSFRTFVNRKKQSGALRSYHQENFLNIIYFAQKLLSYNIFDRSERKKLRQAIEQEEVLTERNWLLAQL